MLAVISAGRVHLRVGQPPRAEMQYVCRRDGIQREPRPAPTPCLVNPLTMGPTQAKACCAARWGLADGWSAPSASFSTWALCWECIARTVWSRIPALGGPRARLIFFSAVLRCA
eukprot:14102752-Alexandrium_andersonii.AAC.1